MSDACYIDTETKSSNPIAWGTDAYFDAPDADCIMVTWIPPGARGTWQSAELWDRYDQPTMPDELAQILANDSIPLIAHNSVHDRTALLRCLKRHTKMERWRCTRAQAYSHGYPGALETLGSICGLGLSDNERKLQTGHQLIQLFCVPDDKGRYGTPWTHPTEWAEFCKYAKQDTVALRKVHQALPSHNYRGDNLALWWLDQRINARGFGYDTELARAAVKLLAEAKTLQDADIQLGTHGAVQAATQRERLLRYLNEKHGAALKNLRAATIRDYLDADDLDPEVRFLLETRLEAAKSSGSKYKRGLTVKGRGDRIRHALQFNGAGRTGRTSGKGFQPHNLARPNAKAKFVEDVVIPGILQGRVLGNPLVYGGPNEACANALRGAIIATPGNELTDADWSNIEGRILPWLAGAETELEMFRAQDRGEGEDAYKALWVSWFGGRIEDVTDDERQGGKVSKLAFNYGGGVGALVTMAASYNMDLTKLPPLVLPKAKTEHLAKAQKAWRRAFLRGEDYGLDRDVYVTCDVLKQMYREANKEINALRYEVDRATKEAVRTPGSVFNVGRCTIWSSGSFLIIQLPSGRRLLYANPKLHTTQEIDPETGKAEKPREHLSYLTARGKGWIREKAWSGLFIENIVQAIANDILRDALRAVHADTLTVPAIVAYLDTLPEYERTAIVLHVHDSITLDLPPGLYPLARLIKVMTTSSPWAKGLPLAATGWVGRRFKKG